MTSTKDRWKKNSKVVVVSFGLVTNLCKAEKITPGMFKVIIIDESHMLKNPKSQRTKYLLPVIKAATRRILLSGTPAFAKPNEMFAQINAIADENKEDPNSPFLTEKAFVQRYGKGDGKSNQIAVHMKELHLSLGSYMIRRYKKDILKDLKAKVRILARFRPTDSALMKEINADMKKLREGGGKMANLANDQRKALVQKGGGLTYAEAVVQVEVMMANRGKEMQAARETEYEAKQMEMLEETGEGGGGGGGEEDLRKWLVEKTEENQERRDVEKAILLEDVDAGSLNGVAVAFRKDQTGQNGNKSEEDKNKRKSVLMKLYKSTGRVKIPAACSHVRKMFSDPNCGKLCIFAHHSEVLDGIASGALHGGNGTAPIKYMRIDGTTLPKKRQEAVTQFQNDPHTKVALLSITAAGVAVTLTASSRVLFAELFWTPAILMQAEDRCHRIGQLGTVRCKYLIARNTVDDVLWRLADEKIKSLGEFVEGKKDAFIEVTGNEDGNDAFSWGKPDRKKKGKKTKKQERRRGSAENGEQHKPS